MIRAAKSILVISIVLLGCYRDPLLPRSAPAGEPALVGGAQSGGDAAWAADGPSQEVAVDGRGRDGSATMDARQEGGVVAGDAAIVPNPGRDAGTVLPGNPDAPGSRFVDAGVAPASADGPVTTRPPDAADSRPTDTGVTPGTADAPVSRPTDAGVTPGTADGPVTIKPSDALGPPEPSADSGQPPAQSDAAGSRIDASSPGPDAQPLPGTVLPGGACTDSGQCVSLPGQTAICVPPSIGFPSGYCAVPGCSILAQNCPGGAAALCIPGDNGPICIGTCNSGDSSSCRPGYLCQSLGPLLPAVCVPGCLDSTGCPAGATCFPVAGSPVGQCRNSGSKVGDPCAAAVECPQNGLCVSEIDFGWPYGYCVTSKCATSADCAAGTACTGDDPNGMCALRCTGDSDCRTGYHCSPAGRAGESVCVPHCTSDSQCENLTCHIGTGLC
jgi:hypothetical protein